MPCLEAVCVLYLLCESQVGFSPFDGPSRPDQLRDEVPTLHPTNSQQFVDALGAQMSNRGLVLLLWHVSEWAYGSRLDKALLPDMQWEN